MGKLKRRKEVPKKKLVKYRNKARKIQVPRRELKRRKGSERNTRNGLTSKLTLRKRKIIYAAVKAGLPLSRCRHLVGCQDATWRTYLEYGKDPRFPKYYNFVQKIKRIEKQREIEALNVIRTAAKGGFVVKQTKIKTTNTGTSVTTVESTLAPHWQAAAWFLERKDKLNWGKDNVAEQRSPMELAQEVQAAQELLQSSIPIAPEE